MRSQPLTPVALLLTAGIVAGSYLPIGLPSPFVLAAISLCLLGFPKTRLLALCLLIISTGWIIYTTHYVILSSSDLRVLLADRPALAKIKGAILDPPTARVYTEDGRTREFTVAHLRVSSIELRGRWQPALGDVVVSTPAALPAHFFTGQQVLVDGVVKPPAHALAEGLFDYKHYLYTQRIFYELNAESAESWQLITTNFSPMPLTDRFQHWAAKRLAAGLPAENDTVQMLWSMTLGTRTSGNPELIQPFMRTGTLHIFAISGLHVACIAGVLVVALHMFAVPRHVSAWIVLPLIWFYTAATGWQSSAIRSAIMSSMLIFGWAIKRPISLLNSLSAAAVIILLWQPEQLFQASFQLSFVVVLSIALFMPTLEKSRVKLLASDPLLPLELRPHWKKAFDSPMKFLTTNLAISVAAFVGALPLVAWYFNLVTPNSLIANLVDVPLSSLALASSLGALLSPWPFLFNFASWAAMDDLARFTQWIAKAPLGFFYVPKPTFAFFILYYAILLLILTDTFCRKTFWRNTLLCLAVLAGAWWSTQIISSAREITITMLPIRGTPIVVDSLGRSGDMLIDCSGKRDADRVLTRYLRAQGFNSLPRVLLSHGDISHVQGFEIIDNEFAPREIITSGARFRSPLYQKIIEQLEKLSPTRLHALERGDSVASWQILHPSKSEKLSRADDKAIVLYRELEGLRILLLSDLGGKGQKSLLRAWPDLQADVVLAGMPENDDPLGPELLEKIHPQLILLGTTKYPARAQGSRTLRDRLAGSGIPVFYTGDSGAITLRFANRHCKVSDMEGNTLSLSALPRKTK
jgi:competence protein ComEC